ncbi:MAG TPA: hypothetical protein PK297_06170 [Spirochaetota bacterium]|nr:hypothetical protein [Spirochaetota bacterium]
MSNSEPWIPLSLLLPGFPDIGDPGSVGIHPSGNGVLPSVLTPSSRSDIDHLEYHIQRLCPESDHPGARITHASMEILVSNRALMRCGMLRDGQACVLQEPVQVLKLMPGLVPDPGDLFRVAGAQEKTEMLTGLLKGNDLTDDMLRELVLEGIIGASLLPDRVRVRALGPLKARPHKQNSAWGRVVLSLIRAAWCRQIDSGSRLPAALKPAGDAFARVRSRAWYLWLAKGGAGHLTRAVLKGYLPSWFGTVRLWAGIRPLVEGDVFGSFLEHRSRKWREEYAGFAGDAQDLAHALAWLVQHGNELSRLLAVSGNHQSTYEFDELVARLADHGLLPSLLAETGFAGTVWILDSCSRETKRKIEEALAPGLKAACEGIWTGRLQGDFVNSDAHQKTARNRFFERGLLFLLLAEDERVLQEIVRG